MKKDTSSAPIFMPGKSHGEKGSAKKGDFTLDELKDILKEFRGE